MTWPPPFKALPRAADDLICGVESGAEVVYAEFREAEEAADRRHDFSDHLPPFGWTRGRVDPFAELNDEVAWLWHMGPDR